MDLLDAYRASADECQRNADKEATWLKLAKESGESCVIERKQLSTHCTMIRTNISPNLKLVRLKSRFHYGVQPFKLLPSV